MDVIERIIKAAMKTENILYSGTLAVTATITVSLLNYLTNQRQQLWNLLIIYATKKEIRSVSRAFKKKKERKDGKKSAFLLLLQ